MSRLALYLLGPPRVELDGEEVHIGRRKALALLAYLAVTGERHRRDSLATLLWPEYDQSRARADLRRTLSLLNRMLGEEWITADRESARLDANADPSTSSGQVLWLDVAPFQACLAECEAHGVGEVCAECVPLLEEAVALYRDDFLAGFTLRDSLAFDEWQFFQTQGLRDDLTVALERLVRWHGDQGEHEPAIAYARRWLALDPTHEPAHRRLMALYAQADQRGVALRQYEVCRQALRDELGVEPAPETTALYERIRAGEEIGREREDGVPVPHNLPPQPTPFIGREAELADLDQLIADPAVRLITIVGPGGIGKTRLALACAERQLQTERQPAQSTNLPTYRFTNGIFFVPLAALSSAEQIVPSVAEVLDFRLGGGERESREPRQQVLDYLREKRLLLVLDNLEHLITPPSVPPGGGEVSGSTPPSAGEAGGVLPPSGGDRGGGGAADLVAELLRTAPGVKILVSSRERLPLQEQQLYPIQGLDYPDDERSVETADYSAAQLFLGCARRVQPGFELGDEDLVYLARICRLLEGTPLGIELAAGWVDALSLADVAGEISQSLDFLETEWRDVPARHRSMRAVFDASWRGLSKTERETFPRLCVFRGGFTRAAAQEVSGADLRTLARLVDKSLLRFSQSRERYEIHELLRQYGAHKLAQHPEGEAAVRDRHSAFFCTALGAWVADLKGPRQRVALAEIEADLENVRAAWAWAAAHTQIDRLDQAADGWAHFHTLSGRSQDGERAFALAQEQITTGICWPSAVTGAAPGEPRAQHLLAKVTLVRCEFNRRLGQDELAANLLEQSQALLDSPALADQDTRAERAYLSRLSGHLAAPDWEAARRHHEESLALYRVVGDPLMMAWSMVDIGEVHRFAGDYDRARSLFEESLASFRTLGCHGAVGEVLMSLGWWARDIGDYDAAKRYYEESLAVSRVEDNRILIGYGLACLAYLALFQGRFEAAGGYLRESLAIAREMGDRGAAASHSNQLAVAFWFSGEFDRAYGVLREGLAIARELGTSWPLYSIITYHAWLDAANGNYAEARTRAQRARVLASERLAPFYLGLSLGLPGWVALAEERYSQAQKELRESLAVFQTPGDPGTGPREYEAWSLAALGRAEHGLGNRALAQRHLLEALEIVVETRAFIPFLHLMPVIPVVLIDADEPGLKERAVELYAMAESHPFVARAQLFADIAGQHVKAAAAVALPPAVVEAAQARGRALDWWETAEALLSELRELGWGDG